MAQRLIHPGDDKAGFIVTTLLGIAILSYHLLVVYLVSIVSLPYGGRFSYWGILFYSSTTWSPKKPKLIH
jgi:hypothetical protein